MSVVQWILDHEAALAGFGLFAVSEIMAFIPSLKSNSILQFILNVLTKMEGTSTPEVPVVK